MTDSSLIYDSEQFRFLSLKGLGRKSLHLLDLLDINWTHKAWNRSYVGGYWRKVKSF